MQALHIALIFVIGAAVSAFGTLAGFGGGVFMIPILVLAFGVPMHVAVGGVVLALVPSAFISTVFNWRNKLVDFVVGIIFEIPTAIGAVAGAIITAYLPASQLQVLFGVVVVLVGLQMARRRPNAAGAQSDWIRRLNALPPRFVRHSAHGDYQVNGLMMTGSGLLAGLIAGMFGIGGGFLKTPIMVLGFGMPARIATATALFMIIITSFIGAVSHYALGHVEWRIGVVLLASFACGAIAGNLLGLRISENRLVRLIGAGLIAAGMTTLVFALLRPA
jgi:hypothetical protein